MRDQGGSMQMALGAAYAVDRFVRTPDEILSEVLRQECAVKRPRPQSKRRFGDMTRPSLDEPQAKLWERQEQLLGSQVIEILDLWHVVEKLRTVGAALFGGLKQMVTKRKLRGSHGQAFHAAITYFANNQQRTTNGR